MLPVAPGFSSAIYLFGSLAELSTCSFTAALALNCQFGYLCNAAATSLGFKSELSFIRRASWVAILSANELRKIANLHHVLPSASFTRDFTGVSAIGAAHRALM
jgi:hypothetical protein